MPPKNIGTMIILDVGRNVSTPNEKHEKSFFENAKECTARIIERKIMSQGNNLVGIMLLGSKNTKNNMAEQVNGAFRHIEVHAELQEPTWQMIRKLPNSGSSSRGDWVDGLLVAADYFKNIFSGVKLSDKKIILMTNFQKRTSVDTGAIEQIIAGFINDNLEVDVIGPDFDSEEKNEQLQLAGKFVDATNGITASFELIMNYLLFHKKKDVNTAFWNVDLSIGPNIKIPVSAFVRIKDEPAVKKWCKTVKDPVTSTSSTTKAVKHKKEYVNPENQQVVDSADKGYNYGHEIIPLRKCDKKLLYEAGEKCLSVYGFTDAKNIGWQNFDPDGLLYVSSRKDDKKAQLAIRCLVECLHELNLIAIVRKVHNTNNAPKMFALMPVIDSSDFVGLSMATICFKDDIKQMSFPSTKLKQYQCSDEQVNACKELIAAMDLTKAYDPTYFEYTDTETFPIAETVSPSVQYILDCIAYRALNPGKPLPEPRDEIMSLFKMPPSIEKRSKEPLEKLKKLFVLNKVEVKTRKIKNIPMDVDDNLPSDGQSDIPSDSSIKTANMPKIHLPILTSSDDIKNIGTVNPVGDFKALMDKNKALLDLTPEMIRAIESLIYSNLDGDYSKAVDAMLHLRTEHVKVDPTGYNTWILKLKRELNARKNTEVLNLIKDKGADVILKEENTLSTYENTDSHEDSQLYENDTLPNSTELTIRSEINDIFDEM